HDELLRRQARQGRIDRPGAVAEVPHGGRREQLPERVARPGLVVKQAEQRSLERRDPPRVHTRHNNTRRTIAGFRAVGFASGGAGLRAAGTGLRAAGALRAGAARFARGNGWLKIKSPGATDCARRLAGTNAVAAGLQPGLFLTAFAALLPEAADLHGQA